MNIVKIFYITSIIFIVVIFFFGPLIPFNPFKIGYQSFKTSRSKIYSMDSKKLGSTYRKTDAYMADIERELGLRFNHNVQIIVTKNKSDFKRYLPWIDADHNGAKTLPFGNIIYINSQYLQENGYSDESFLISELIHQIIYQNTNFLNATSIDNQAWVAEGLSAYYGGLNFYSETKFDSLYEASTPTYSDISFGLYADSSNNDPQFNTMLYKHIVNFIISNYGEDTFKIFLKSYIDSPVRYRKLFSDVYGRALSDVMKEFEESTTH